MAKPLLNLEEANHYFVDRRPSSGGSTIIELRRQTNTRTVVAKIFIDICLKKQFTDFISRIDLQPAWTDGRGN